MTLITSAAYVNSEFQVEFGCIPPSFLPVGNKKLIQYQVGAIRNSIKSEAVFLTLPESYLLNIFEVKLLDDSDVRVIKCGDCLSLGESIKFALNQILQQKIVIKDAPIRILHGDTLVSTFPVGLDFIGISILQDDYNWEIDQLDEVDGSIWCGCFAFRSLSKVVAELESKESFSDAIRSIDRDHGLARVRLDSWMDFGHINTYFQSRSQLTTQRSFNSLAVSEGCVRKTGKPGFKIIAERKWYQKLPATFKRFSPQLIDFGIGSEGDPYYVTEYLPIPPLNEIFVHGRNSAVFWRKAIRLCIEYLGKCRTYAVSTTNSSRIAKEFNGLVRDKTESRLEAFSEQNHWFDGDKPVRFNRSNLPSVFTMVEDCLKLVEKNPTVPGLLHGDFCFSNILYDSRIGMIKVIDPRGLNSDGVFTNLGDIRYDMAKLTHSVIGLYDFIISGAFDCRIIQNRGHQEISLNIFIDERIKTIQKDFLLNDVGNGLSVPAALPMVVLLFFSMLPLHQDNPQRQLAFLANGCKIYSEIIK